MARLQSARQRGQVVIYTAMLLTVLMGLAGAGVDYGLIVIESAKLQNALDAAALAGSRALITSQTLAAQDGAGQAAVTASLALHGYTTGVNGATFVATPSASDGGAWHDTMTVNGTIALPTKFWQAIGIRTTNLNQTAVAAAGAGMVDVMISLDLSGSMELSGTDDLGQLRGAVVDFINQMQIDATDPRSTKMGIARWAGITCQWSRGYSGRPGGNSGADSDQYIDIDNGPEVNHHLSGGDTNSEYTSPCSRDQTVVSNLTQNKANLIKIADGSGAGSCPTGMSSVACPLVSWRYTNPPVKTGWGTPTTVLGLQDGGSSTSWYQMTGTRLDNSLNVVSNGSYYAWSTANGGRNDPLTTGVARKVLVIMTDGFSESGDYGIPVSAGTPSSWDTAATTAAASLKLGPDGTAGTTDDVEIYVVGFYCTPYSTGGTGWCASRIADSSLPHACPGPNYASISPSPSTVDNLLKNISSSSTGTCDHYFPIKKTEDLPQLFRVMAGSIARGRLQ